MVDRDVAARKIANASSYLAQVHGLLDRPMEEFLGDLQGRDLAAFYLQLAIQDCIDLAVHWVSDAGWSPPEDAASAFTALADHQVIPRELARVLEDAVRLRNRIAHGYALIDHQRLYDEAREGTPKLKQFLATIAEEAGL
jgi:uncharacterized protein YutE (UPF0331/DUF86 family)